MCVRILNNKLLHLYFFLCSLITRRAFNAAVLKSFFIPFFFRAVVKIKIRSGVNVETYYLIMNYLRNKFLRRRRYCKVSLIAF